MRGHVPAGIGRADKIPVKVLRDEGGKEGGNGLVVPLELGGMVEQEEIFSRVVRGGFLGWVIPA